MDKCICLEEFVHMSAFASRGQRRVLGPLKQEFQETVSSLMWELGTELMASEKAVCVLNC